MFGIEKKFLGLGEFHDLPEVHDCDPVADILDHGQVMGDKKVREAEFLLKVFEEVDHLSLDGNVEGGYRLIRHDQLRPSASARAMPISGAARPKTRGDSAACGLR